MKALRFSLLAAMGVLAAVSGRAETRTDALRARLLSNDRSYVFVALHQGDHAQVPGNSSACVQRAIALGADIVEVDVRQTKDGKFVLQHDATLDRGTTGKGRIADFTREELRGVRLLYGGKPSECPLLDLEELFAITRGRILVNIDKFDEAPERILDVAQACGCLKEVLVKTALPPDRCRELFGRHWPAVEKGEILHMPMIQFCWGGGNRLRAAEILPQWLALEPRKASMYEFCAETSADLEKLAAIRRLSPTPRIWLNGMWDELCVNHGEAPRGGGKPPEGWHGTDPDFVWGWALEQGATMIQTDNGRELMSYLERKGRRPAVGAPCPAPAPLVITEQTSSEIQILNGDRVVWRCRPWEDPHVALTGPGPFKLPDEAKPIDGGKSLLFAASQAFGEIDVATRKLKWYGRVDGSPHSIERLPDGRFAVACSWGMKVVLVDLNDAPFAPEKQRQANFSLRHAHGVAWDAKRNCLWAVGEAELVSFEYRPETFELVRRKTYPAPQLVCGHDLVLLDDGTLVATGGDIFQFDPEKETFDRLSHGLDVKSYSVNADGAAMVSMPREKWWTDRLFVKRGGINSLVGPLPGAKIYKARWFPEDVLK